MALFFSSGKDKSVIQQALEYIQEASDRITIEEKDLNNQIEGSSRKIMPVTNANLMGKLLAVSSYRDYDFNGTETRYKSGYYTTKNDVEATCKNAIAHADYLLKCSKEVHEANKEAIENNILLADTIRSVMKKIGIPSTYTEYDYISSSGRRTQKRQEHTRVSGYANDINKWIKITDGFTQAESSYSNFIKNVEEFRKLEKKKEDDTKRAKEAEEQVKRDTKELATLVVKYKLEYEAGWEDVLNTILAKDKYLHLGYWLERQRNSWADGFWKAKNGIEGFEVETGVDKAIYDEITSLLEDADDGRVFRDCQFNYSTLYSMVEDEELYTDYCLVFDKISSDLD